jgi:hypothetical protein
VAQPSAPTCLICRKKSESELLACSGYASESASSRSDRGAYEEGTVGTINWGGLRPICIPVEFRIERLRIAKATFPHCTRCDLVMHRDGARAGDA